MKKRAAGEGTGESVPRAAREQRDTSGADVPWGSRGWFERALSGGPLTAESYYGHRVSGYQIYRHTRVATLLRQHVEPLRDMTILDVGCALGDLGRAVTRAGRGLRVVGMDFVPSVAKLASALDPAPSFLAAALPELPFRDSRFDLILAAEVLYYLRGTDRTRCLDEIARVLRPSGWLLFSSPVDSGVSYFTVEGAVAYLSRRFVVRVIANDNNRAYWFLKRQLERVVRRSAPIDGERGVRSAEGQSERCKRTGVRSLLDQAVLAGLKPIARAARWGLSWVWLPRLLGSVTALMLSASAVSNTTIIAHKRPE